jgi:hypothetical protein
MPKNPSEPKQVHLALTGKPGEMNITWITFEDPRKCNIKTYWQLKDLVYKIVGILGPWNWNNA